MEEKIQKILFQLLQAINNLDEKEEIKISLETENLLKELDKNKELLNIKNKIKLLLRHYQIMVSLQKIPSENKNIQEIIDKNG